jgi:hypothetical protein
LYTRGQCKLLAAPLQGIHAVDVARLIVVRRGSNLQKYTFALRQITAMNDVERLQHLEQLTARLNRLEAKKEAAVDKALQEGKAFITGTRTSKPKLATKQPEKRHWRSQESSLLWQLSFLAFLNFTKED